MNTSSLKTETQLCDAETIMHLFITVSSRLYVSILAHVISTKIHALYRSRNCSLKDAHPGLELLAEECEHFRSALSVDHDHLQSLSALDGIHSKAENCPDSGQT